MMLKLKDKLTGPIPLLAISLLILFLLGIYPFGNLLYKVLFPANIGFTLNNFTKLFDSSSTLMAMRNTIWVSLATGLLSLVLALPLSFVLSRTDLKGKGLWRSLFCLPYAIPPYIGAIAWIILANPTNGLLKSVLPFFNIYSMVGLIWVMGSFFYTFVLLSMLTSLDRMDPSLEEAARLSGAGPIKVFLDVTLPIVLPSMVSGLLLVILATAASFGVPALIGNPARIFLMTTQIYTFQKMGSMQGIYFSGSLSVILLLLSILLLFINQLIMKKRSFQVVGGKVSRSSVLELGHYSLFVQFILIVLFSVIFVMPVAGILLTSLSKVQGVFSFDNFGFQNFKKIFFEVDETPRALLNSFKLATSVATIAMFLGLLLGYIKTKTNLRFRSLIELVSSIPYATPGTVLALSFILTFGQGLFGLNIYNTLFFIGMAYLAKYLNFSLRTSADGLSQIDDCLAQAARVSGASWSYTLKTIWLPLMKPALIASWFLVFMPAFSELTMTILLSGPGTETLGTLIFQLQEYGDASGGGASVLALVTIVFVALVNLLVRVFSKGKYGL